MTQTTKANPGETRARAGKYLTFTLGPEVFGLAIGKIREILRMMDITPVPLTPTFIKGVVNLRGRVIPVMDLRAKFEMPAAEAEASTCIIVVYVGSVEVGVIVDDAREVLDIEETNIEPAPDFGAAVDTRFITGIAKAGEKVTLLLDVDKALSASDVEALTGAAG